MIIPVYCEPASSAKGNIRGGPMLFIPTSEGEMGTLQQCASGGCMERKRTLKTTTGIYNIFERNQKPSTTLQVLDVQLDAV
jgi:hypothetical protein